MAFQGRQVADLEERMDRRRFLKLSLLALGAVAVPPWVAGCLGGQQQNNTKPSQNKEPLIKYVTAKEAQADLIDTNGDSWPDKMKSYKSGDTLYVKDILTEIIRSNNNGNGLVFKTFPREAYTPYSLNFIVFDLGRVKEGDTVVFISPVGRYVVGGHNNQDIYGDTVWDSYDTSKKNKVIST